jgi:3'(2'), 5'-bisphosphate nucleotidase
MTVKVEQYQQEIIVANHAAREAGAAILELYEGNSAASYTKHDGSTVTDADLAADEIIRSALQGAFPDDPILTEESADNGARLESSRCWIVDPIDGTNQFVRRTGEFDVLIALIVDGRPVMGLTYQPTTDLLLWAAEGSGAWYEQRDEQRRLCFQPVPPSSTPRLMTSVWLGAPDNLPALERASAKMGGGPVIVSEFGVNVRRLLPDGDAADSLIGFRASGDLAMAWEWDFAGPEIVIREAGGKVTDLWGNPHRYNKPVPRNNGGVLIAVDPESHARIAEALRPELPASRNDVA